MILYSVSIAILGIVPALLLFAASRLDRSHTIAHPLRVIAWVVLLGYSLKSFYLAYAVSAGAPFRTQEFTTDYLYIGQLMVILATLAFILGFGIASRMKVARITRLSLTLRSFNTPIYWAVFLLAVGGVAALFYLKGLHLQLASLRFQAAKFFVSEESGTRSSLGFLLVGADILVVFFLYYVGLGGRLLRINLYLPAIMLVALNYFLSSQRTGVVIIIVGTILVGRVGLFNVLSRFGRRRLVLVSAIFLILSSASFIRQGQGEVTLSDINIVESVEATAEHVFEGIYALDPSKLTGIVLRHEEFLFGQSFAMFLVAPIPRVLWPGKPNVRLGPYVAQELLDYRNESGAPPSGVGEFYINFGWTGVALGMLLLGGLAALARSLYYEAEDPNIGRVRYALGMLILIFFIIGDFSYAALFIIKYSFAAIVCEAYWRNRSQPNKIQVMEPVQEPMVTNTSRF